MEGFDKRYYRRGIHFGCDIMVSRDGEAWQPVDFSDLSGGGVCIKTDSVYEEGEVLWMDLTVCGFLSLFEVKVQGEVCRVTGLAGARRYGLAFIGMDEETKVRIDENVLGDRPVGGDDRPLE